ncbi:MAG: hypothetical protein N2Z80_00400 [Hydrogenothermaceae bacterium]|nr:hypothetical protein [Hydrogenothermaceae bacterium]
MTSFTRIVIALSLLRHAIRVLLHLQTRL